MVSRHLICSCNKSPTTELWLALRFVFCHFYSGCRIRIRVLCKAWVRFSISICLRNKTKQKGARANVIQSYNKSPWPEPPYMISGKGFPRISPSKNLGYWLPLAITKHTTFPGFLGKSTRDYGQNIPPPPLFRELMGTRMRPPYLHSSGGPGTCRERENKKHRFMQTQSVEKKRPWKRLEKEKNVALWGGNHINIPDASAVLKWMGCGKRTADNWYYWYEMSSK